MLAIRMQRLGRKGLAHYRLVVQDSRRTPTSGRVVFNLGSYDPHTKKTIINIEKAQTYLDNGAQPSDRVATILQKEGVKMPNWYIERLAQEKSTRNSEKLRKNQPKQVEAPEPSEEAPVAEPVEATQSTEEPVSTE
jgi:small subunit ribosomal protein S16